VLQSPPDVCIWVAASRKSLCTRQLLDGASGAAAHRPHPRVGGGLGPLSRSRLRTSRSCAGSTRHTRSRHDDAVVEEDRRRTNTFSNLPKPAHMVHVADILGERTGMAVAPVCYDLPPPATGPTCRHGVGVSASKAERGVRLGWTHMSAHRFGQRRRCRVNSRF
jgi:hypothetical protein